MDPMTALAIAASLGGAFFKDDPAKRLLGLSSQYASPEALFHLTNQLYSNWMASPAFSGAQGSLFRGASAAQGSLRTSLANRGLSTSGIGDLSRAVGQSLPGIGMANLQSQGWSQSIEQAMNLIKLRLGGAGGLPAGSNIGANLYGAGLNALGMALKTRNPGTEVVAQNNNGYNIGNFGMGAPGVGTQVQDVFNVLRGINR